MIPVNKPLFISDEKKFLDQCIDSGWISSDGPFVKEFESSFSKYIGKKYGAAVSSGTAALEVAVGALGLKPGDEVIMPTFTIISCASAVVANGGVPIFIDSETTTWNMDVTKIEKKITKKTKAIMVVHMYGHSSDMDTILKIAEKHKLLIIEDAAEVHGAKYKGRRCGSFGDISCFSFYGNKIITTGEGGMVLTDNSKYFGRAKFLRNLGFDDKKRFHHTELTRNYRMTNLQAAIGVAQLHNVEKLIKIKRNHAKKYNDELKDIKGLQLPVEKEWAKNVYWMYGVVLGPSLKMTAEVFAEKLFEKGIQTRPFFYPMHLQPVFKKLPKKGKYPVAERIAKFGLYLPSGLGLKDNEIKEVCNSIKKILSK
ncbi:MAG: DegT/DnrJ/EryC1/StrS family aminotransferase [Candidatus Staskawiczbacteria bacterium]|nr:DegT/DnrJ/EryC1/StrS family aminotransferase [Candidatus Staskawiczbacteria bacterium]